MTKKEIILQELNAMGYEPTEVESLGYVFCHEDKYFLYSPEDDDEEFLRIAIPQLYDVTEENRIDVIKALHETAYLIKYSKPVIMYTDSVWAIYEHKLVTTDNLSELLEHIIRVLEVTAFVFQKKINGEELIFEDSSEDENSDDSIEAKINKLLEEIEL
ncbi:MAG: hypothetical protein IKT80_06300 [Bacteroidaceae bacterium]|nr:hypothetical protein [Bacteroidaceae bacterium]